MTQPSLSRQLYALVHRLPAPSKKRGAGMKAKLFLGDGRRRHDRSSEHSG
jgi:hypothetical protein